MIKVESEGFDSGCGFGFGSDFGLGSGSFFCHCSSLVLALGLIVT